MTDQSSTPADDTFDEGAALADIMAYSPDRARGAPAPAGGSASSIGGMIPRSRTSASVMPFKLSMLSPEQAGNIPQRLAAIADPAARERAEAELVEARMTELANAANVRRGHPNGNAVDREVAAVSVQVLELEAENQRLLSELNAVSRYEVFVDPATGEQKPVPVQLHTGAARARMEDRILQNNRTILELDGEGGKRRIDRAAAEELERRRAAHEEARIAREADKLARTMVADERIKALAEAKAKGLRSGL